MATDSELKGKIALITGCTGGIGKSTAIILARLGCSIAIHYNTASQEAAALVTQITSLGVQAASFQADFTSYDAVRKMHAEVVANLGHPDILFNNAGLTGSRIGPMGDIQDVSPEEFEHTWRANTGTHYLLTQLCLPHMQSQKFGRIIFCSSVAANTGGIIGPHYASSKSAMHGLVHWIASRYSKEGITCNAIAPGLIKETTMMNNLSDENRARIPVGRFGLPPDIASIVEMLVKNSYMTNKIIVADGGITYGTF